MRQQAAQKTPGLAQASEWFLLLTPTYLRLCNDLGLLTLNQYRHVSEMVAEIGRLLGGWKRSVSR